MVTDGEICPPNEDIKQRLKYAHEEMGLEVRQICSANSLTSNLHLQCSVIDIEEAVQVCARGDGARGVNSLMY